LAVKVALILAHLTLTLCSNFNCTSNLNLRMRFCGATALG
jgi:hypothetical protein